jgi:phage baseplate assembly protein gpV
MTPHNSASAFHQADQDRRLANMVELGNVTAVDNAAMTVRVDLAGFETDPLPVAQIRSGVIKFHWMPSVGEQVAVLSPGGDLARAFVMGSVPIDGSAVAPNAQTPTIDLGGGKLRIVGSVEIVGPVEIVGAVTITGDVNVTGKITSSGDVVGAGISLKNHKHGLVQAGTAQSGAPL